MEFVVMRNHVALFCVVAAITGCVKSPSNNLKATSDYEYASLAVTSNELQSDKWAALKRTPAKYPAKAAMSLTEGCATIEYVVTPENDIKDIKVVFATDQRFAVEASKVIKKWNWDDLPKSIIAQPVKTQTRFDFCINKSTDQCKAASTQYACPSNDIIYSEGFIVKEVRFE